MKITGDVNSANMRLSDINADKNTASSAKGKSRTSDPKIQNNISKGLQRERAQIDALIIAQVSRDIIQRAMTISARLQSVASAAFTTGKVDTLEVRNQVSFIENDITDYGGTISSPVSVPLPEQADRGAALEEFSRLKNSGHDLMSGQMVNPQVFADITENLSGEYDSLGKSIDAYYSGFRTSITGGSGIEAAESAGRNLSLSIVDNPSQALYAQGNLNQEVAGNLALA